MSTPNPERENPRDVARRHLRDAFAKLPDGLDIAIDVRAMVREIVAAHGITEVQLPRHRVDEEDVTVFRIGGGDAAAGDDSPLYARIITTPGGVRLDLADRPDIATLIRESEEYALGGERTSHVTAAGNVCFDDDPNLTPPVGRLWRSGFTSADNAILFGAALAAAAHDARARFAAGERASTIDLGEDDDDTTGDDDALTPETDTTP